MLVLAPWFTIFSLNIGIIHKLRLQKKKFSNGKGNLGYQFKNKNVNHQILNFNYIFNTLLLYVKMMGPFFLEIDVFLKKLKESPSFSLKIGSFLKRFSVLNFLLSILSHYISFNLLSRCHSKDSKKNCNTKQAPTYPGCYLSVKIICKKIMFHYHSFFFRRINQTNATRTTNDQGFTLHHLYIPGATIMAMCDPMLLDAWLR